MDPQTLSAYERDAAKHGTTQLSINPRRMRELVATFFTPAAATADIGCGAGRDTEWLSASGYEVLGCDASKAMLKVAKQTHPKLDFAHGVLPDLPTLKDESFQNVLVSAVLMHLQSEELITACINLLRVTKSGGRIIVTFRASRAADEREADGRLYTPIAAGELGLLFESLGGAVLLRESRQDEYHPDVVWHTVVVEKDSGRAQRVGAQEHPRSLALEPKSTKR